MAAPGLCCHRLLHWTLPDPWKLRSSHGPYNAGGCSCAPVLSHDELKVVGGTLAGKDERRKRLRLELMRWHPDKFEARFGRRLRAADRPRILDRVKSVSQALNALAAD